MRSCCLNFRPFEKCCAASRWESATMTCLGLFSCVELLHTLNWHRQYLSSTVHCLQPHSNFTSNKWGHSEVTATEEFPWAVAWRAETHLDFISTMHFHTQLEEHSKHLYALNWKSLSLLWCSFFPLLLSSKKEKMSSILGWVHCMVPDGCVALEGSSQSFTLVFYQPSHQLEGPRVTVDSQDWSKKQFCYAFVLPFSTSRSSVCPCQSVVAHMQCKTVTSSGEIVSHIAPV